jgi:ferritin-like protein
LQTSTKNSEIIQIIYGKDFHTENLNRNMERAKIASLIHSQLLQTSTKNSEIIQIIYGKDFHTEYLNRNMERAKIARLIHSQLDADIIDLII